MPILSNDSADVITPVIADAAAVSGETRYTPASAVPLRPLKLRLNVRKETPALFGAKPCPRQGPHALSKILNPAAISSPKMPDFAAIISTALLPGAIPASTPGAMCLPLTIAATLAKSSSELFVHEPITTCVAGFPAIFFISVTASGECGCAASAESSSKFISMSLSYSALSSAFNSVQSASRPIDFSSEGKIDVVAPSSAPIFVIVARCGTVRLSTPLPKYS